MDLEKAATNMQNLIKLRFPQNEPQYPDPSVAPADSCLHLIWMCERISKRHVTGAKGHRWLGFVQGVCVARNIVTLEECKEINHKA